MMHESSATVTSQLYFLNMDLREPQPHFRYPDPPAYLLSVAESQQVSTALLRMKYKCEPLFYPKLYDALKSFFKSLSIPTTPVVGCLGFPSAELQLLHDQGHVQLRHLSRDPSEFETKDLEPLNALTLSQPQWADGFFFPEEVFASYYMKLRLKRRELPFLVDESLLPLVWSTDPAGTSQNYLGIDKNLWIVRSMHPALSPVDAAPSFIVGSQMDQLKGQPRPALSSEDWILGAKLLQVFERGEGQGYAEFQRRQMALRESVRFLTDYMRPLLIERYLTATSWPEAAFYLLLRIEQKANPNKLKDRDWVQMFAERSGIQLGAGSDFNAPGCLRLCFAGSPRFLRKFGEEFVKQLLPLKKD